MLPVPFNLRDSLFAIITLPEGNASRVSSSWRNNPEDACTTGTTELCAGLEFFDVINYAVVLRYYFAYTVLGGCLRRDKMAHVEEVWRMVY